MDRVVALLRYPLKSAAGEALTDVAVEARGVRGDRRWACVDLADDTIGSVKHPGRWRRLLAVRATTGSDEPGAPVTLHVGGREVRAGHPEADAVLSEYLGRPVRLSDTVPERPRLHRLLPDEPGMVPDWMAAAGPGGELVSEFAGARGAGFVDFGPVHVITTAALDALAGRLGRARLGAERFRPNLVLDTAADLAVPGVEFRVGEIALRTITRTPRCIVPALTRRPGVDRALLAELAAGHRVELPGLGRAACFGGYAEVLRPGRVRIGDAVHLA